MVTLHFSQIFWLPYLAVWWDRTSGVDGGTLQLLPPLVSSQHGEGETLCLSQSWEEWTVVMSCVRNILYKRETAVDTQDTYWPGFGQLFAPWPWRINWVTSYDERGRGMEHVAATPHSSPTLFLPAAPAAYTCLPHVFSGKNPRHSGVWCAAITDTLVPGV